MQDPTHDEMIEALSDLIDMLDGDTDDAEIAAYWFANDWHGGQSSNLYSALSTSIYSPGPIATMQSEGDMVAMMYRELEQHFAQ